jgi:hypothetical protein
VQHHIASAPTTAITSALVTIQNHLSQSRSLSTMGSFWARPRSHAIAARRRMPVNSSQYDCLRMGNNSRFEPGAA